MSPFFSQRKKNGADRRGASVEPQAEVPAASAAEQVSGATSVPPQGKNTADSAAGPAAQAGDVNPREQLATGTADTTGTHAGGAQPADTQGAENAPAERGGEAEPRRGKHTAPVPDTAISREERMLRAIDGYRAYLREHAGSAVDTVAVVDLTHRHPSGGAAFAAGSPTLLSSLIREEKAQQAAFNALAALRAKIERMSTENGYAPTQLAIGSLTWTELPEREPADELSSSYEDTGELKLSPEIIARAQQEAEQRLRSATSGVDVGSGMRRPGSIARGGAEGSSVTDAGREASTSSGGASAATPGGAGRPARATGTVREISEPIVYEAVRMEDAGVDARITQTFAFEVNPAIQRALRAHGTPVRELRRLADTVSAATSADDILDAVRRLGHIYLPGASYRPRVLLGTFTDAARTMLDDVEAMRPYIADSGLVAAVEGDAATRKLSAAPLPPANLADRAPEAERGVGDHDVRELAVIEAVATGRNIAVNTPPGSHAIETLAGVVADAAASGRSVLYVPGNGASGAALKAELDRLGVGDLVLDLTDVEGAPYRLRTGLRQALPEVDLEGTKALRSRLREARERLETYVRALHTIDPEWRTSLYAVLEKLAELTEHANGPATRIRLPHDAARMVVEDHAGVAASLEEAARLDAFAGGAAGAWSGSPLDHKNDAARALSLAQRLAAESIPLVMSQSQRAAGETGLARPATLDAWFEQVGMLEGVAATLDVFQPAIYERSAQDMVVATATEQWRRDHGEEMKRSQRRALTKRAQDYLRPGVRVGNLHAALEEVQTQRDIWRRYNSEGGWPKVPAGMPRIRATADEVSEDVSALAGYLDRDDLATLPFEDLLALTRDLASQSEELDTLVRRNRVTGDLRRAGFGELIDDLAAREVTVDRVVSELDLAQANALFEQLVAKNPDLAAVSADELSVLARDVRALDKQHTSTLPAPVHRAVVARMRDGARKRRDETLALDAELRDRGPAALAGVMASHRDLVQLSRPVWIMPALMVARYVPHRPWADLVIMDGLGHSDLATAVSVMTRGSQLVVAGDSARCEEDSAFARISAALPMATLPTFRGFYDDFATEFLTAHGLADGLTPIPGVGRQQESRLTVVDGRGVPSPISGMVEGPAAEVNAVVDAVVEHYLTHPDRTLGVVSISRGHAEKVAQAVREMASANSVLARALAASPNEPFEVVTLDGAANLHRDRVILTVGLGKTTTGRVLHTFGDLGSNDGVEGLVAGLASARERLTVISSIAPEELGLEGVTSPGTRLLAALLTAAAGGESASTATAHPEDSDALLRDLAKRLTLAGFSVALQYGYENGPRVPLAVGKDGVFSVAVLWDDDAYAAESSLRRRDRYWPEVLEAHGWQAYRTYSTSVFLDPQAEVNKIARLVTGEEPAPARGPVPQPEDFHADSWETYTPSNDNAAEPAVAEEAPVVPAPVAKDRGPAPRITAGLPLAAYSDDELDEMTAWIASDELPRTEEQLMDALRAELDIRRRGTQVDAILRNVVRRSGLARN